jgi:nucleotide-binding universal stress UspA family protein
VANEDAHRRATLWSSPQLVRRDAADVAAQARTEAEKAEPDIDVSVRVVVGPVVPELASAAADADLLVVGCRGLGAFAGLLLGSVSERLANHPPGPVVVVRGDAAGWGGPVLLGMDGAPESASATEFAVAAADRRGVPLWALTAAPPVWPVPPPATPVDSAVPSDGVVAMLRTMQADALEPALQRHPAVRVEHRILFAAAAPCLIEASGDSGLVVVGAGGGPLGSVGGHVLRHAACPVAIVPAAAAST